MIIKVIIAGVILMGLMMIPFWFGGCSGDYHYQRETIGHVITIADRCVR